MGQLYGARWSITIKDQAGNVTPDFELWCSKLSIRQPADIAEGFRLLEQKVGRDYSEGKESWPPSYAEFGVLCKPYKFRENPEQLRIEKKKDPEVAKSILNELSGMMKDE